MGISAGATFLGALNVAKEAKSGSNILCMLPDTGERYLSTPLFEGIDAEMSEEETAISQSTAGFRFDVSTTSKPSSDEPALEAEAIQAVDKLIGNPEQAVTMFALEWCEFCWSVRKVFRAYGIEYQSIDLDSVAYQQDNQGAKLRVALREKTQCNTFPQIFIKGEYIGGCTDLFDGCKHGSLISKLQQLNIPCDSSVNIDPYSLLPGWLHPR